MKTFFLRRLFVIGCFFSLLLAGCGGSSLPTESVAPAVSTDDFHAGNAGLFRLWMHDQKPEEGNIEHIFVTILKVEVGKKDGTFVTLNEAVQEIDLLQLQNNVSMVLGERYLEIGTYDSIRLILSDQNRIIVDGEEHPLFIPSGEQTGIKLQGTFEAQGGRITEMVIDFVADESVHLAPGKGYILRPVIRLESVTTLGPGLTLTQEQMDAAQNFSNTSTSDDTSIHWSETPGTEPSLTVGEIAYPGTGGGEATARSYFVQFKNLYGLSDPNSELKTGEITQDEEGRKHVALHQVYQGVPVYGASALVHLSGETVLSVGTRLVPQLSVDVVPTVFPIDAEQAAIQASGKAGLKAQKTQLVVFNSGLILGQRTSSKLAWAIDLANANRSQAFRYFVDAKTGVVLFHMSLIKGIHGGVGASIEVSDINNNLAVPPIGEVLNTPNPPGVKSLVDSPSQEAHDAYNFSNEFYEYVHQTFGRHSYNHRGATLINLVRYPFDDPNNPNDEPNAGWDRVSQTLYSPGWADQDVVAHEWTHALTDYVVTDVNDGPHGFEDAAQPGALSESYSDFFAAMIDTDWRNNGAPDWKIGEDIPAGDFVGRILQWFGLYNIRDMSRAMTMTNYRTSTPPCNDTNDWCGIHTNVGIPNYAAYLVTTDIKRQKAEWIYYRTLRDHLQPTSQFTDAALSTRWGVCSTLIGTENITADDCNKIGQRFADVGLDTFKKNLIPNWFGAENQGGGMAAANLDNNGRPEIIVMHVDNPVGENSGHYRIGSNCNRNGYCSAWTSSKDLIRIPGSFGTESSGAGIAVSDLDGNGSLEFAVVHIESKFGPNLGWYRIGSTCNASGVCSTWTDPLSIPNWTSWNNPAAGIAAVDLDGKGGKELVVMYTDAGFVHTTGWYRVGSDCGTKGCSSWGAPVSISGTFGTVNQGADITVADLNGSGGPEFIVSHIDQLPGENQGYYRVGFDCTATGCGRWGDPIRVPGWFGAEDQGNGVAVGNFNGVGGPELLVLHVDNPAGENAGYYRVGQDCTKEGICLFR